MRFVAIIKKKLFKTFNEFVAELTLGIGDLVRKSTGIMNYQTYW